jgi:hypothetical protein
MKTSSLPTKLIVTSCLIVLTIASCKKSTTSPGTYSISFSNGGTATTYTTLALSTISTGGGQTLCGLSARNSDGSSGIVISVNSNSALSTNITYTDTSSVNAVAFELANSSGTILGASSYAITPNVKLNFTAITSTYVRGTFSGNMAPTAAGTTVFVSNGIFYLPIN